MTHLDIKRVDQGAMLNYRSSLGNDMRIYSFSRDNMEGLEELLTRLSCILLNEGIEGNGYKARVYRNRNFDPPV